MPVTGLVPIVAPFPSGAGFDNLGRLLAPSFRLAVGLLKCACPKYSTAVRP